jgi:hypothetical protein
MSCQLDSLYDRLWAQSGSSHNAGFGTEIEFDGEEVGTNRANKQKCDQHLDTVAIRYDVPNAAP